MPSAWLPTPPASSPVLLQWFSSEPDPIALSWSRCHTLRRAASVFSLHQATDVSTLAKTAFIETRRLLEIQKQQRQQK